MWCYFYRTIWDFLVFAVREHQFPPHRFIRTQNSMSQFHCTDLILAFFFSLFRNSDDVVNKTMPLHWFYDGSNYASLSCTQYHNTLSSCTSCWYQKLWSHFIVSALTWCRFLFFLFPHFVVFVFDLIENVTLTLPLIS